MRRRLCRGILILQNKNEIAIKCLLFYNNHRFYRARAQIIIDLNDVKLIESSHHLWTVGVFFCTEHTHDMDDHIYQLTATDNGKTEPFEHENFDSLLINTSVIHLSRNDINIANSELNSKRPNIDKI